MVADGTRAVLALVVCALALGLSACGDDEGGSGSQTLTWFIFNEPSGSPQAAAEKCVEESNGAYEIEFEFLPATADGQREQLVRRLGAEDDSIDLIGMDVIWTGEFANAGWIEPFPDDVAEVVTEDVFPSVVKTAEFEGQLYAAPLWSNTELLWYRTDRVPNAAEDLGRDDRPGRRARARGGPDPGPGEQVRGPGGLVQPDDRVGRHQRARRARRDRARAASRPSGRSR